VAANKPARAKLSYKEGRELEQLPAQLEALENEQQAIAAKMAAADYHATGADSIRADRERLAEIERLLEERFVRWAELDARASQSRNS
jgi:ATP-binding cassette subfamily F protein uup